MVVPFLYSDFLKKKAYLSLIRFIYQEIKLRHIQVIVSALLFQKLFVGSFFQDAALIYVHDAVSIFDGGKPMSDDKGGTSL